MSSITQVRDTMQTILTSRAKELERKSGFVERSSAQLDGQIFSQTTVLTWMHSAEASYTQLRHTAASLGVQVSNQAIELKSRVTVPPGRGGREAALRPASAEYPEARTGSVCPDASSRLASSNAMAKASTLAKRCAGSLARACSTTCSTSAKIIGTRSCNDGGSLVNCWNINSVTEPSKGRLPHSHS